VARYYVPWARVPAGKAEEIKIDVRYGKLQVAKGGTVDVAASVKASRGIKMAMVDLGVPPGFRVDTDGLDSLKSKGIIDRYELTHRQIIIYLRDLRPGKPVAIRYSLRSLYPVRATVPVSQAYDYYNPETMRATTRPLVIQSI
jgi:alpha-2-macroglobulin-like protein